MNPDLKPSALDKIVSAFSPAAGIRRLAAKRILHEYRYDGASNDHRRASAPHDMSPNSFTVQRDRLQLMREAEDMERNFAPAFMLNRKVAMYSSPLSYHSQTGDAQLNKEVEDYLNEECFPHCDVTGRYDFFKMMEFGVMGCNRGGDYGWAFQRPGFVGGMSEDDVANLPLKIQAVEPDRIGGIYQNVVSDNYVSGLIIGDLGQIEAFRVFRRSMTTNVYDNPIDIPAASFVHYTDPLRIDQYRGVSTLATSIQNLRDLYEMIDFVKGKAKIASALTVFTNSNGAIAGAGAMDAYSSNLPSAGAGFLQQDIQFGQINHLAGGTDIKFPASNSPSTEEQALMTLCLKMVAMSYNLPYSFALDASALGGVSSRLESELAKAEFERRQRGLQPHADRIKNAYLFDAIAKGIFPASTYRKITRGRWGYRSHPQPDIGREASAAVSMWQSGLLNPIKHWVDGGEDPENVATDMARWAQIKQSAAASVNLPIVNVFGAGPSAPITTSVSTSEQTDGTTKTEGKEFSRKEFKESDSSIQSRIDQTNRELDELISRREKFKVDVIQHEKNGASSLVTRSRIAIDTVNREIQDVRSDLAALMARKSRRDGQKASEPTPEDEKAKAIKAIKRDNRHALVEALKQAGHSDQEAYAISYDIIESGKFNESKLPKAIRETLKP